MRFELPAAPGNFADVVPDGIVATEVFGVDENGAAKQVRDGLSIRPQLFGQRPILWSIYGQCLTE